MNLDKATLEAESAKLPSCPFCGGRAEFYASKNDKAPLHVRHLPAAGANCPARFDQHCESFEQGAAWWGKRV